jgi:hypothetical protein
MKHGKLLLACGVLAGLGLVVSAVAGTVVLLMFLNPKQAPQRAEVARESRPASELQGGEAGAVAPQGNKLMGQAPEAPIDKRLGDEADQPIEPLRKPSTPIPPKPPDLPTVPKTFEGSEGEPDSSRPIPKPSERKPDPPKTDSIPNLPVKPTKVTFLNVTAEGQRFCIIADNSGSMAGEPMASLKRELAMTLADMKPENEFFVIFFNSVALPMPSPGWLKGTKEGVEKALRWINLAGAGGGTEPTPAFELAFRLNPPPDVIFFMTDGIIPDNVPANVAAMNRGKKKVKINTIMFTTSGPNLLNLFTGPTGQETKALRQIANDSGGTYRHYTPCTPEDLAKAAEGGNVVRLTDAINHIDRMGSAVHRVIPRLLAALAKASPEVRTLIIAALRRINFLDATHVPALAALLDASTEDLQLFGLEGLAFLRGEAKNEGLPAMMRLFARSDKATVLSAVIKALQAVAGPDRSLAELYRTRGLKASARSVRLAALAALRKLAPEELPSDLLIDLAFNDSDADMRRDAQAIVADRMKTVNESNLPEVRALLKMKRSSEAVRLGLLGVTRLGPKAKECMPELLELFGSDDAKVRQAAVPALRAMGPAAREAAGPLAARLADSSPAQKMDIALVLAAIDQGNAETAKVIAPLLVQNLNPETLPDKQGPPEMLLESIKQIGEPAVDLIFAGLAESTGKRGAVAANHRKYLFQALERLGRVAFSEANLRIVAGYTSPKKELFADVRTAAGKARRAMSP